MGSTGRHGFRVLCRMPAQHVPHLIELVRNEVNPVLDLEHSGGVHDVLGGRSPVHEPAHLTDLGRDLFDDVEDRIPDVLRAYTQTLEIDLRCVSSIGNGGSGIYGDEPHLSLRPGQGRLGRDHTLEISRITEDLPHIRGPEDVLEQL